MKYELNLFNHYTFMIISIFNNRCILLTSLLFLTTFCNHAVAQTDLLENFKNNSQQAKELCLTLLILEEEGQSAYSIETTALIAKNKNLSTSEAEILITYVYEMQCKNGK